MSLATEVVLIDNIHSTARQPQRRRPGFRQGRLSLRQRGRRRLRLPGTLRLRAAPTTPRATSNMLSGKILRITRDGGVPPDNPFLGAGTARCNDRRRHRRGASARRRSPGACATRSASPSTRTPLGARFFINDVGQDALGGDRPRRRRAPTTAGTAAKGRTSTRDASTKCARRAAGARRSRSSSTATRRLRLDHRGRLRAHRLLAVEHATAATSTATTTAARSSSSRPRRAEATSSSRLRHGPRGSSAVHLRLRSLPGRPGLYYTNYQGGGQVRRDRASRARQPLAPGQARRGHPRVGRAAPGRHLRRHAARAIPTAIL